VDLESVLTTLIGYGAPVVLIAWFAVLLERRFGPRPLFFLWLAATCGATGVAMFALRYRPCRVADVGGWGHLATIGLVMYGSAFFVAVVAAWQLGLASAPVRSRLRSVTQAAVAAVLAGFPLGVVALMVVAGAGGWFL